MFNTVTQSTAADAIDDDHGFQYGCCIDAGSSGSRIYLYRWPQQADDDVDNNIIDGKTMPATTSSATFIKVERKAIFSQERTPGISHEGGLGIQAVQTLVALAKAALPPDVNPKHVPIYLGATAGMRIVIDLSQSTNHAATTMVTLQRVLHQSGFLFRNAWARTISGEEEGVYAWLGANYLMHNGNLPMPTSAYGAMDLGGASTQISFLLSKNQTNSLSASAPSTRSTISPFDQHQFPLRIDHLEYPLFTQSLLYYGVDQARSLYDEKYASEKLPNPCYPSGYRDELTLISGSSDWEKCLQSVANLFDQLLRDRSNGNHCCEHEREKRLGSSGIHGERDKGDSSDISGCHNTTVSQLLPIENQQKFIAMSTFVYTWDWLGLRIGSETDDLRTLNAQAQRVCNMTHNQQVTRYEQHMEYKAIKRRTTKSHTQCFNAAFSYHLLSKGYGLPIDKTPIEIHYEIGGTRVQWALGLMLVEVNKLGSIFHQGNYAQLLSHTLSYPPHEHERWSCELCTYHGLLVCVFVILIVVA